MKDHLLERSFRKVIWVLCLVCFGVLAATSVFTTIKFSDELYVAEHFDTVWDNVLINLLVLLVFFGLLVLIKRKLPVRLSVKWVCVGLMAYTLGLGLFWIFQAKAFPAADAGVLYYAAQRAMHGRFDRLFYGVEMYQEVPYFHIYPFQLGTVFLWETLFRVVGSTHYLVIQIANVGAVCLIFLALIRIAGQLFADRSVQILTAFLCAGFLPILFFTTFAYGNLIGLCFSLWAVSCAIAYAKSRRGWWLLPVVLCVAFAGIAKYNNLIVWLAVCLFFLVFGVTRRDLKSFLCIFCASLCLFGARHLIEIRYERQSGETLGPGMSQWVYLDMGLQKGGGRAGWYSSYYLDLYRANIHQPQEVDRIIKEKLGARLRELITHPRYALVDVFYPKAASQWNEPTYQSIWVSKVITKDRVLSPFTQAVYEGPLNRFLEGFMNQYQQILFLCFAACLLLLRRSMDWPKSLLLLILLGGFSYHQLFEAKSQYILTYIPMMIPYGAYGAQRLATYDWRGLKGRLRKRGD